MREIDITDDTFVSHVYGDESDAIEPDEIVLDDDGKSGGASDRNRQDEWFRQYLFFTNL